MQFKELPAQKCREGLDKECDKFCAEINRMYCTCIEKLNKWMKPMKDFSCFMWMTLSEPPNWNNIGE